MDWGDGGPSTIYCYRCSKSMREAEEMKRQEIKVRNDRERKKEELMREYEAKESERVNSLALQDYKDFMAQNPKWAEEEEEKFMQEARLRWQTELFEKKVALMKSFVEKHTLPGSLPHTIPKPPN